MNKPMFIKARVCIRIDGETVCTTKEKKVVLAMVDDAKGTLLDGREVVKIDNWWYYIPPHDDYPWGPGKKKRPLNPPEPPEVEDEKTKSSDTMGPE
jgi:hypothetical protein